MMSRSPPDGSAPTARAPAWIDRGFGRVFDWLPDWQLGRRLDRLPARVALPVAALVGLAIGWGLLVLLPLGVAVPLFLLALAGATLLALQGAPRLSGDPPASARPRPNRRPRSPKPLVPDDWWVPIPAGEFAMGSPDDEVGRFPHEGPVHRVRLSAFECLRFPMTRGLVRRANWRANWLAGPRSDRAKNRQSGWWTAWRAASWLFTRIDGDPLVIVNWHDAIRLCNRFSAIEGRRPCFRIDGDSVYWDRSADGWRLLTEAEWEYACRAGTTTRWSCGDDEALLAEHAWYSANAGGALHPVGLKRPNPWGLHDMHGLVWEWCWDWFGDYPASVVRDPTGPAAGASRVLRGGAFNNRAVPLRTANRFGYRPVGQNQGIGFRCARSPAASSILDT